LNLFLAYPAVDLVTVAIGAGDDALYSRTIAGGHFKLTPPVTGGDTRQHSVLLGLQALAPYAPDRVLIHDAVRPFVTADIVDRVLKALAETSGAIAAVRLADTLKRADAHDRIAATLERDGLWRAQTPQAFRFTDILAAHQMVAAAGRADFTDDAAIAEWAGLAVTLVDGSEANRKLTTAEDLAMVQGENAGIMDVRTGQGFDVHRFTPGDHLWLCGVRIAHTHALAGHSDADVGLHALTDALLGAIGDGDIGEHFPDTDPEWAGADSLELLRAVVGRVGDARHAVTHVDATVVMERPKLGAHKAEIRSSLAAAIGIPVERVNVKASTGEGMGFVGRGEGVAALAVVTLTRD
jgi:2-C-methyl-D-erythritol 4-phosphate cytidylyltransferase/2-C-methyl-D-erythritol 2,4-cyclodiphosphate synthase